MLRLGMLCQITRPLPTRLPLPPPLYHNYHYYSRHRRRRHRYRRRHHHDQGHDTRMCQSAWMAPKKHACARTLNRYKQTVGRAIRFGDVKPGSRGALRNGSGMVRAIKPEYYPCSGLRFLTMIIWDASNRPQKGCW